MTDSTLLERPQLLLDVSPRWWVCPLWFLATAIIGVVSWGIMSLLGGLTWGITLLGIMTVTGASVGAAQWLVLQPYTHVSNQLSGMTRWTIQSALGATLGWYSVIVLRGLVAQFNRELILFPEVPITLLFVGGAASGLVQWLTWKNIHFWRLVWWTFVSAFAWCVGGFLGIRVGSEALKTWVPAHQPSILLAWPEALQILVAGAIAIPIYGLMTAFGLLAMFQRPKWK